MKKITKYLLICLLMFPLKTLAQDDQTVVAPGNPQAQGSPQMPGSPQQDLSNLSLESLGNIVTSVSKKPEDSFRSPAAIYVITNEDIKLSGATHIAEVLRGVPGLDVAQIDASNWAISSRGFNSFYSNKLLVLVDGRTIFTPMFSGVYWDIQNIPLEDIDRIEVIRGPGAALWGSNAVNGVINIITKSAADTQGTYASTLAGNQARSITDVRYGGKIDDDVYYRAYAMHDERAETQMVTGQNGDNSWENSKAGFRSDWSPSSTSKATLQGDIYAANINLDLSLPSFTSPTGYTSMLDKINSQGGNMLGRWTEQHSDTLQSTFQAYYDYQSPNYAQLQQQVSTFDFDYQTSWKANDRNDITWGAGARYIADNLQGNPNLGLTIPHPIDNESILNAFIQDQYALIQKELYLTIGSKFEQNSLSGFVPEPDVRLAWYPDNKQTVWGAISRAVTTPGIIDESATLNAQTISPGVIAQEQFNANLDTEKLTAYEVGYRIKPVQTFSIDTTAFLNEYDKLITFEPGNPVAAADGTYIPFVVSNLGKGYTYGFEESANWDVTSRWNLLANYSYINMILNQGSSLDPTFLEQEHEVPHHQFSLRSRLFLPYDVQMVNQVYYVDKLPAYSIDEYVRFDTQFIWKATNGLEFSLVGQNLLDNKHEEFAAPPNGFQDEIPRAYYAKVTVRY